MELSDVLKQIVDRIVEVSNPDRIVLFGSAARGEMGNGSDLDILVLKEQVVEPRKESVRIRTALFDMPFNMDILVYTTEQYEQHKHALGTILYPVAREGRTLYERQT